MTALLEYFDPMHTVICQAKTDLQKGLTETFGNPLGTPLSPEALLGEFRKNSRKTDYKTVKKIVLSVMCHFRTVDQIRILNI